MAPDDTRRAVLQAGGIGLGVCLAGCSAVGALGSDPTELLLTVWNEDRSRAHEVRIDLLRADAGDEDEVRVFRRDFALAAAAATEEGEKFDEESRKETRVESRPYLVRIRGSPTAFERQSYHYHFRPCTAGNADDLDRLFVFLRPTEGTGRATVSFEAPC